MILLLKADLSKILNKETNNENTSWITALETRFSAMERRQDGMEQILQSNLDDLGLSTTPFARCPQRLRPRSQKLRDCFTAIFASPLWRIFWVNGVNYPCYTEVLWGCSHNPCAFETLVGWFEMCTTFRNLLHL